MKELSIEEKAKRYDKAYEMAKKLKETCDSNAVVGWMEYIFPELKESEDERIREKVIATIHLYYGEPLEDEAKEMIAWLEEQGQHKKFRDSIQVGDKVTRNKDGVLVNLSQLKRVAKPAEKQSTNMGISEATKQKLEESLNKALEKETPESCNEFLDKQGEQKPAIEMKSVEESLGIDSDTYNKIIDECIYGEQKPFDYKNTNIQQMDFVPKSAMEAIKEEKVDNANKIEPKDYNSIDPHFGKPADKVEPKFHEGDWVVTSYGKINQVVSIDKDGNGYTLDDGVYFSGSWCDMYHLWTIQDAKDGDVLVVNNEIFIYAHRKQMYSIAVAQCFVDSAGGFYLDGEFGYTEKGNSIHPATKEQRDLLFQKMKEAGYEWDAEKKKLKKMEQKSAEEITSNPDYISPKDKVLFEIATVLSQHEDKDGSPLEEIRSILINYCIYGDDKSADKVEPKFKVGDEIKTSNEESLTITKIDEKGYWSEDLFICDFGDANKWKLVEQKPAWSEEDEEMFEHIIAKATLHFSSINYLDEEEINFLKSLKERVLPQPKQEWSEENEVKDNWEYIQDFIKKLGHFPKDSDELDVLINYVLSKKQKFVWSEEDETKIKSIIAFLKSPALCAMEGNKGIIDESIKYLKSLKNRVQPQPKQEWSEEEKARIDKIVDVLDWAEEKGYIRYSDWEDYVCYVKSLRPQSTWKPSDEQMITLRHVISGCSYDIDPLVELETKLKEL